ncbi:MAG: hypothetical protein JXB36_19570 [Gammaproteobacteria bacterium]|nr:hypothetical protein [Gammaproteobacteria bacterium]
MKALKFALAACAALAFAGCGEDPLTGLIRNCEAPDDTLPFSFDVGDRRLVGFIDLPAGPGPHPAVVLIQGEGPTDVMRGVGDYEALREAFREAGVASVVWDKAGSGCSSGQYRGIADLYLRSDEVVAAVAALEAREDIDGGRIGAWAIDQGGWVAPMAAVRSDGLSYLIVVGGPGRDPVHQRLYLVRRNLELEGYPEEEIDVVVERLDEALRAMADQAPYEEYVPLIEHAAAHPFMEQLLDLNSDILPGVHRYDELRSSGALDVSARVFLAAVDVPVLALWGKLDSKVDWRDSVEAYRQAFEPRRETDLTVRLFAGANHALCEAETGSLAESRGRGCEHVDGYVDTMIGWLRERGFAPGGPPADAAESQLTNASPEGAGRP